MTDAAAPAELAERHGVRSLLTTEGRAGRSFRFRAGAAFATIATLHLIGLALLTLGMRPGTAAAVTLGLAGLPPRPRPGPAAAVTLGLAGFAYVRGLAHAFDFDHISMIDNSTRKFVTEGRNPASVG